MTFKTIAQFLDPQNNHAPTTAERALIAATEAGTPCVLSQTRPTAASDANRIRAPLLRLLILGGTPACGLHEIGVRLEGGWIEDHLALSFCTARGQTFLDHCHFETAPGFYQSHLRQLSLEGSFLPGLSAQSAQIDGDLFLRVVTAQGTVAVNGAKIGGKLACEGASFDGNGEIALDAQGVDCGAGLFLRGVIAKGTVDVSGARIGGQLVCDGAKFDGSGEMALNAQGVECGADIILRAVTAKGTVAVNGAKIGGQLVCGGASFDGIGEVALNAHGVDCAASLFLRSVTTKGTVDVGGAKIGRQLSCIGASFDGNGEIALDAQGVDCGTSLLLRTVTAKGTVDMNGARIGGQLDCTGASFDGGSKMALNAQSMQVTEGFLFRNLRGVTGPVVLTGAHVGDLADDMASWPKQPDSLNLNGFTYDRIEGPTTFAARRDWLAAGSLWQSEFFPQPYTQLAGVLRQMGHHAESRRALSAREHQSGKARRRKRAQKIQGAFLKGCLVNSIDYTISGVYLALAGFRYTPVRSSLLSTLTLCVVATFLAHFAWEEGSFAPNSDVVLVSSGWADVTAIDCFPKHLGVCDFNPAQTWSNKFTTTAGVPTQGADWDSFSSIGYAADLVVPFLDLGQTDAWAPSKDRGDWGWVLWWARWLLAALGWVVTGLGVAAVTGVMQRNQPD